MSRQVIASWVIRGIGVLLLVVAVIHLAVTSLLKDAVLDRVLAPAMMPVVAPPFVLNHVVVGLLLVPLGFTTIYSATGLRAGQRWAWVICFAIGVALLSLPVALFVIMRGGPFDAVPFRIAEALVMISAITMPGVLLWIRLDYFPKDGTTRSSAADAQTR
jgi:hypothetical protein